MIIMGTFIFILILLLCVLFNFIMNSIVKRQNLDISIKNLINNTINEFKMDTILKYESNTKSYYHLVEDAIYMSEDLDKLSVLCEGLHEFGHAFINTFNKVKCYTKDDCKTITYIDGTFIYNDNNTNVAIRKNKVNEQKYFGSFISYFLNYSILFALLFALFGISGEIKGLVIIGIVFSIISTYFLSVTMLEEINASKIAYELLVHEKILTKKQLTLSKWYLFSALLTYIILTISSSLLFLVQIVYLFR